MPRLSDSMEDGTVLRWLKASGDQVRRGDELVDIETDKATITHESDVDGVLEIVAGEGSTLPIGGLLALIVQASAGTDTPIHEGRRIKASPAARRIARERGLDLADIGGSGPGGRIVLTDLEGLPAAPGAAAASRLGAPEPVFAPTPAATGPPAGAPRARGDTTKVEPTSSQQIVARRMAESRTTVPDFTLESEIEMERCVELRAQLAELASEEPVPSYNDFVIKACALALREHPRVNGSYVAGRFELHSRVNVGVAVTVEDALLVPTVFDADTKSLAQIASETQALADRARVGGITPLELSGGTFTVSNLGMFGITNFTAVINPPQAAILAVGTMTLRPVVRQGDIVVRNLMEVSLSCDHRILQGAEAALFLGRIRQLLEQPLELSL